MSLSCKTGEYYGGLYNNMPNGQGTKKFYDNSIFTGTWNMGTIYKGILKTNNFEIEVEYENGNPYKLLKVLEPSFIIGTSKTFTFPIAFKQGYNCWEEILPSDKKLTYTAYFSQGCLKFDGILFQTPLKNIIEWDNGLIIYYGEYNNRSLPEGYCEINFPYFRYLGLNKHFKPHGHGKKYYKNGIYEEGIYENCELNGWKKICQNDLQSTIYFCQNHPQRGEVTKDGFYANINFQNLDYELSCTGDKSKESEMKKLAFDIYNHLLEAKMNERNIYDGCSLKIFTEYVRNKDIYEPMVGCHCQGHCNCYGKRGKIIKNESFFVRGKNWYEYEVDKLNRQDGLRYERVWKKNWIFKGEISIGKGKIATLKGFFKGKVRNREIGDFGEAVLYDVGVYHGEFENGKRDGVGMMRFENGTKYKGYWKDDKFHGQGYYFDNGNVVYGQWENGLLISSFKICLKKKL